MDEIQKDLEKIAKHYNFPIKPVESYPFIIGNKVVKVKANGIKNAIDRVTSKHQNKFINITHAKNMDLISAKVEAAKQSRAERRKIYIIVDDEGECELNHAPLKGVLHCYNNGSEIALENDAQVATNAPRANKKSKKTIPAQSEKAQQLINKKEEKESTSLNDSTKTKTMATKPAKKAAKKVATKKTAPKKDVKPKEIHFGENPDFGFEKAEWTRVGKLAQKEQLAIRPLLRKYLMKAVEVAGF